MNDEKYYKVVADELRENRINDALWTKAIAKSQGDENKTKATYIQLRVEQLMLEEKRALLDQTAPDGGSTAADAGEEATPDDHGVKKLGLLAGQAAVFLVGVWLIWKYLFPWVRALKGQWTE